MQKESTVLTTQNDMSRLVLTRKLNEEIVVHQKDEVLCSIKISKIDGKQVRLAFDADEQIKIDRKEIFKQLTE